MMPPFSFLPVAFLVENEKGEPMRFDDLGDGIMMNFLTPGLIFTVAAIGYALAIVVVRRKKKRRPFSPTYWLVLGSGIAMLMVPFASAAIESVLAYFRR